MVAGKKLSHGVGRNACKFGVRGTSHTQLPHHDGVLCTFLNDEVCEQHFCFFSIFLRLCSVKESRDLW